MDENDPLQAYTTQIVALGQAALAHYRRGAALPDELSGLAASLLALEDALRAPAAPASETPPPATDDALPDAFAAAAAESTPEAAAPDEPPAAPDESPVAPDEPPAAPDEPPDAAPALFDDWLPAGTGLAEAIPAEQPTAAELPLPAGLAPPGPTAVFGDDNAPDAPREVDFAAMTPVEADDWLSQFAEESSGMLVISEDEPADAPGEQPLVVDVEEEAGGGPAVIATPLEALPPLVIDPISLPAEEDDWPGLFNADPVAPAPPTPPAAPEPTGELQYCTNCGATLRPGRRFCYRCGASVAEMTAEVGASAPPTPAPEPAWTPPPAVSGPPSEWPTIVGDMPNFEDIPTTPPAGAAALARFCNNCGLGVEPGVTVCPECGSRDLA